MWHLLAFLVVLSWPSWAYAQQDVVDRIVVLGLDRTAEEVVRRELTYQVGDTASDRDINESLIRIRNTELFSSVQHSFHRDQTSLVSTITVEERWTTIPIFKFNRGGGVSHLVVGAYDINLGGRYLEGGAQVERLGATNSAVIWYRNPRFLDQRMRLAIDAWDLNRVRLLYEEKGTSARVGDGFMHHRQMLRLALGIEWLWWLNTHAVLEGYTDQFNEEYLPDEAVDGTVPRPERGMLVGLEAQIGRINKDGWLVDGSALDLAIHHGLGAYSDQQQEATEYSSWEGKLSTYYTLFNQHTLGLRLAAGASTASAAHQNFYVGGLDKLRGYKDGRFRGRNFWLINTEYRLPSWRSDWVVLQHTVFYDAAAAFDGWSEAHSRDGQSVGVGLRFIAPKVYRFVGRLDWAYSRDGEAPLSFGVQQFF